MRLLRYFIHRAVNGRAMSELLETSRCVSCTSKSYSTDGYRQSNVLHRTRFKWPEHGYMPSSVPSQLFPLITTKEEARNIISYMNETERSLLMEELKQFKEMKDIQKDSCVSGVIEPATSSQLYAAFIYNGLPFIGFGILDNGIMIIAGEYIDVTIGVTLGISTMAAAALGNLISDVAGVGSTGYVEQLVSKLGVTVPNITPEQSQLRRVRWTVALGRIVGITIGCLVGMLPLLFFPDEPSDTKRSRPVET